MNTTASDLFIKTSVEIPNCSICLDSCKNGLGVIACGHVFHEICVDHWIKTNQRCPICRAQMRSSQVLPLRFKLEGEGD